MFACLYVVWRYEPDSQQTTNTRSVWAIRIGNVWQNQSHCNLLKPHIKPTLCMREKEGWGEAGGTSGTLLNAFQCTYEPLFWIVAVRIMSQTSIEDKDHICGSPKLFIALFSPLGSTALCELHTSSAFRPICFSPILIPLLDHLTQSFGYGHTLDCLHFNVFLCPDGSS